MRFLLALALVTGVIAGTEACASDGIPGSPVLLAQLSAPSTPAEYRRKFEAYRAARAAFEAEAEVYWNAIVEQRRGRNAKRRAREPVGLNDYVLSQPPVYGGPPKPVDPAPSEDGSARTSRKPLPVVADFLRAAVEQFQFVPQRLSELEFKRAYARQAASAGLSRDQIVRVYAFETGGNGAYDLQSGLTGKPGARAISTAIGYNQLLTTNSVELMAEQGSAILKALSARAQSLSGTARRDLERKILIVKRMVAFSQSVPDQWSEHEKLARTPQGWAVHAMALDIDVGPLLQMHKLLTSVAFARTKGHATPLTAAELEMMNLTGDGTGLDMVMMPSATREQVPTSNFFQRSGYERNPVAIRHNTAAKLLAVTNSRMDSASAQPGARDLAAAYPSRETVAVR